MAKVITVRHEEWKEGRRIELWTNFQKTMTRSAQSSTQWHNLAHLTTRFAECSVCALRYRISTNTSSNIFSSPSLQVWAPAQCKGENGRSAHFFPVRVIISLLPSASAMHQFFSVVSAFVSASISVFVSVFLSLFVSVFVFFCICICVLNWICICIQSLSHHLVAQC